MWVEVTKAPMDRELNSGNIYGETTYRDSSIVLIRVVYLVGAGIQNRSSD